MAKNKMKTNKSAAKRFSFTGSGKVKYKKAGLRHFMRRKSAAAKRGLRQPGYMVKGDSQRMKRMLPYG